MAIRKMKALRTLLPMEIPASAGEVLPEVRCFLVFAIALLLTNSQLNLPPTA